MAGFVSLWKSNGIGCDVVALVGGGGYVFGFYGVGLVMSVLQCVEILVVFVRCVVRTVLWWLCGVDKCGFALLVSMGSLGG